MTPIAVSSIPSNMGSTEKSPLRWYTMYGLRVRSDFELPMESDAHPEELTLSADLVFAHAGSGEDAPQPDGAVVGSLRCEHGTLNTIVHRGPGGSWLSNRGVGVCHLLPGDRRVDVYLQDGVDPGLLGLLLAGQMAIYTLFRRGVPSLHASAVVTGGGAIAFMGVHGQGKSTMAASLLTRGAAQLTDDALALYEDQGGILGQAGPRFIKLWLESAEGTLELGDDLPCLVGTVGKKRIAVTDRFSVSARAPLRALHLLERFDPVTTGTTDVTIVPMRPRDAVGALLGHLSSSMFASPGELASLLPFLGRLVAQAPVRVLRYPDGYEHQDRVAQTVLHDGEQQ